MKVRYDRGNCAYLEDDPQADGSYLGQNKYTEEPVRLRWDGEQWLECDLATGEVKR